jgi:hypothetical protein
MPHFKNKEKKRYGQADYENKQPPVWLQVEYSFRSYIISYELRSSLQHTDSTGILAHQCLALLRA